MKKLYWAVLRPGMAPMVFATREGADAATERYEASTVVTLPLFRDDDDEWGETE